MKLASDGYNIGMHDALASYGVRLAAETMIRRPMPEGPMHLGAERLSKFLREATDDGYTHMPDPTRNTHRRDRQPTWGPRTSLEGSATNSHNANPAGVGAYSGV